MVQERYAASTLGVINVHVDLPMELFEKQNKITRIQATGSKVVMSFLLLHLRQAHCQDSLFETPADFM